MKKTVPILIGLFSIAATCFASVPTLTINGKEVEKTVTRITFSGDNAVLHFGNETESHDMNSVMLTFSALSGIDEIITYSFNGIVNNNIELGGIPRGSIVEIYDTNGILRLSEKIDSDPIHIDVSALTEGVYILKAGKNHIKFKK